MQTINFVFTNTSSSEKFSDK